MIDQLTRGLEFQSRALVLRSERQRILAGNIANADTPSYRAMDFDFKAAMQKATGNAAANGTLLRTNPGHMNAPGAGSSTTSSIQYRNPVQPSLDSNSVDMDLERMQFADNAIRFEATLRFLNGTIRTLQQAIRGDQG